MKLFGTDGIRGRANEYPITVEVATRVGQAVATVLRGDGGAPRVLVGRDTRLSGTMLEAAVASGLASAGVDVWLTGPLPTPAVAYLTRTLGMAAGIMITASHNPYEDNGIKIFGPDGFKLTDAMEEEVERLILSEGAGTAVSRDRVGVIRQAEDAADRYVAHVVGAAGEGALRGLKVVLDCGNGAAFEVAPRIFRHLGAEVLVCHDQPDGVNINAGCGALHPGRAGEKVREAGADLGVSFDGDADRVIFSDAAGREVSGDRILALCAIALKARGELRNDTVVVTVMSNLGLHETMRGHGIRVETTAVGDRHVIECMRRQGHAFGGENSGHLIFADHSTTGDGIVSALQVLRILRESDSGLGDLAAVMREYPSRLQAIPVSSKPPLENLPELGRLMREATEAFGDSGRHLIRYSGTENKIRVLVEHREADVCDSWLERFGAAIRSEIG